MFKNLNKKKNILDFQIIFTYNINLLYYLIYKIKKIYQGNQFINIVYFLYDF